MPTIDDLPELILIGILRNVVDKVVQMKDIIYNLPYLAICQRWRYLGVPLVHRKLIIECWSYWSYHKQIYIRNVSSNISLLSDSSCEGVAKALDIQWASNTFIDSLEPLMNKISMDYANWPTNITSHLVNKTVHNLNGYDPQRLDNEMYGKMSAIIGNFQRVFPNINDINLNISEACGIATQFSSKMVGGYTDQLKRLAYTIDAPIDLPSFPPNLTTLIYKWQPTSIAPIPRINAIPLKKLKLVELPPYFSWKKSCNSLVFPNLKSFDVNYLQNYDPGVNEFGRSKPASQQVLELPMAKSLWINYSENQDVNLVVAKCSQNLDNFYFWGNVEQLEGFSKLSIDSINSLTISLEGNVNDMDQFYQVTNRLLGKSIKNDKGARFQYDDKRIDVDPQMIDWTNAMDISIPCAATNTLATVLASIPKLNVMRIRSLRYIEGMADWSGLENSRVATLYIMDYQYEVAMERSVEFILQLCVSLRRLNYLCIPGDIYDNLMEQLDVAKKKHVHLQELLVSSYM